MKKKTAAISGLFFCLILGLEFCGCAGNSPVVPGYYQLQPVVTKTTAFSPTSTPIPTATVVIILPTPASTTVLGI